LPLSSSSASASGDEEEFPVCIAGRKGWVNIHSGSRGEERGKDKRKDVRNVEGGTGKVWRR
jgi:hypothetical protein